MISPRYKRLFNPVMVSLMALALIWPHPGLTADREDLAGSLLDHVPDSVFDPETFILDNGMEVVVITNDRAPVVSHMVWYKVGSADDPRGKSGLAHYLEHLMFKGTENLESGEFSRIIASIGGRENAFTSYEYTGYFQTVAREHLELMMRHEADRMTGLTLDPDEVLAERGVIAEERRQVIDTSPVRRLSEATSALLFAGSPYAVPIIGWAEDIEHLTQADVEAFYQQWYAPNNAVLIVSGDITASELRPLAEKYYGALAPSDTLPERVRPSPHPMTSSATVTLRDAQVERPAYLRSFPTPKNTWRVAPEAYALSVLQNIIAADTTSLLYRELVIEQRVANEVSLYQGSGRRSADAMTFFGRPADGRTIDELSDAFDALIAELLETGVTDEQVRIAKERILAQAIYARDSVSGPARVFGASLMLDYGIDDIELWPQRIAAVTTEMVNAVAQDVFDETRLVEGILLPEQPDQEGAVSQ
ncbi:MAG: pitrilysin family protein [Pseudomonadota bacterium]